MIRSVFGIATTITDRRRKMKKLMMNLVGVFLVFSVFLGTSEAAEKELVVGGNFPLSGPAATLGIGSQRAVDRVVELINEKGFTVQGEKYVLKVPIYDSKYVPAESVSNLEKMLVQGIKYIYTSGGQTSTPLVEKTNAAKVLQLTCANAGHHLTNPKYPLSFRVLPCDEAAFSEYPWLAKNRSQIKNVAHVNPSDEPGFMESKTRMKCAKNLGFKNVINEYFKRGATDFYPVATRVLATKPDLIDLGATVGRDQGLCVKALREQGYKGLITIHYVDPSAFVQIAGPDAAEGVLIPNSITEPTNPKQKAVFDWYQNKYGGPAPGVCTDFWDPLFVFIEAVKKANSVDPVKVAEALRTVRWDSLYGEMYVGMESVYGLKCSFCRPVPIGIVKGGKATHLTTMRWPPDEEIKKLNAD
jgi:branched-chain amino acid transport system substrate-binding protein